MLDIQTWQSLNDLCGRVGACQLVSVIQIAKLFHLFDEEKQLELTRTLGGLLPGSNICGTHAISSEKGMDSQVLPGVTSGGRSGIKIKSAPELHCHERCKSAVITTFPAL